MPRPRAWRRFARSSRPTTRSCSTISRARARSSSKLTVAGPAATGPDDYAKEVAALEDQIQKLEIEVGKKSAAYRATSQAIELAPIQKLIPKDARLVEIVNFQPCDPKAPYRINPILPPRRFAAYVLGPKGDPTLVDLGPATAIDDAVEKFRKAVSNPKNTKVGDLGNALYKLTIGKIAPALGGATDVLLAPDGTLNVVPFSALVDDNGKFLLDTFTFTYLTSGRDLLRLALRSKAQGGGVIFADPAFDCDRQHGAGRLHRAVAVRARRICRALMWPQLPGTGQEADEVEKTFTRPHRLSRREGDRGRAQGAARAEDPAPRDARLLLERRSRRQVARSERRRRCPARASAPPTGVENPLLRSGPRARRREQAVVRRRGRHPHLDGGVGPRSLGHQARRAVGVRYRQRQGHERRGRLRPAPRARDRRRRGPRDVAVAGR